MGRHVSRVVPVPRRSSAFRSRGRRCVILRSGRTTALWSALAVATMLLSGPPEVAAASSQPGSACEAYMLRDVSLGMTPREVRKKLGRKSESRNQLDDSTGSVFYETYRLGVDRVEIEYRGSGTGFSDATVAAIRWRDSVGSQNLQNLAQSLRARYGLPSSGGDNLDTGLRDGPATWVDLDCNLVVVVARHEPDWWESGGDLIELEVRRMAPAGSVTVPLHEEIAGFGSLADASGADVNLGGSGSRAATTSPVRLADSYVPPEYPRAARRLNLSVRVRLEVLVLPDGSVGEIRVLEGTGTKHGFEEAAIDAVKKWRYTPAMRDGTPVAATIAVVVAFR